MGGDTIPDPWTIQPDPWRPGPTTTQRPAAPTGVPHTAHAEPNVVEADLLDLQAFPTVHEAYPRQTQAAQTSPFLEARQTPAMPASFAEPVRTVDSMGLSPFVDGPRTPPATGHI